MMPPVSALLRALRAIRRPGVGAAPPKPAETPAEAIAAPILSAPPGAVTVFRLRIASGAWIAAGRSEAGVSPLVVRETLDAATAILALTVSTNRQLCLLVAPDGRRLAARSDGLRGVAISALVLHSRGSSIVRLQHPCAASRYLGVTAPGQGAAEGVVVFDSGGHTERDAFDFVPVAETDVPAGVRIIGQEFASAAGQPFSASGLMARFGSNAVRPELGEALIRLLRPQESAALARDALDSEATRRLLRQVLPANPWSQEILPALAAWNSSRMPVSPEGNIVSPGSDEHAGKPFEGHGMPQAGHILTALARSQIRPRRNACILTTMRNEGAYLLDWVSYHLSIGFDHIFIYTNDNQDGSDNLLRLLARHGVITLIENTRAPTLSPQHKAYAHGLLLLPQILDYRWTALIDADEYIAFDTGMFRSIVDFIDWQEVQNVDAIALCWLLHVGERQDVWRDESTLRRFPMRERGVNPHVKSLFRTNLAWHAHPHFPHMTLGRPFVFRNEGGRIHHTFNVTERLAAYADPPTADLAWVNHYIFRSAGEAVLKLARGRADQTGNAADWNQANLEHTARSFVNLSRPEVMQRDERILACAAGQGDVLARLRRLPGVADAAQAIASSLPGRLEQAARAFLADVPAAGQPELIEEFRSIVENLVK